MDLNKLNTELYYHPPWPKDKSSFIKLLHQSNFTNKDLLLFAKLYVKYSHIHCFNKNELRLYFKHMFVKMKIESQDKLFEITNTIYEQDKNPS